MYQQDRIKSIAYGALFLGLGIGLPYAFHIVGLGKAFLPMYIPVILGALFLGPYYGFVLGITTPLLSSLLSGMPPFMPPVAPMMMAELSVMGALAGYLSRHLKINVYLNLTAIIITGRIMFVAMIYLLSSYFLKAQQGVLLFVLGSTIASLPGIILQFVVIPPIFLVMEKLSREKGAVYNTGR